MTFNLSDEDGFVSIVNTDTYKGFVDNNWELDQLFSHFVEQMNKGHLIIWTSNEDGGNDWNIEIVDEPSSKEEFRHFSFPIRVTNNCLHLVSYTDLTMAAQFETETLPAKDSTHLKFDISNGLYHVTVRQMFDILDFDYEADIIHFEIIFNQTNNAATQKASNVFWWPD